MTSSGPGGFSQGYRSASAEDWAADWDVSVFEFIAGRRKFAAIGLAAQSAWRQPKKTAVRRECESYGGKADAGLAIFGRQKQKGRHECRPFPKDSGQSRDQ
jgi:hypothetical protein